MRFQSCASLLILGALAASPLRGQVVPPQVDPPLGPLVTVNETAGAQRTSVAFSPEGRYMAVWEAGTIRGRLLDLRGEPLGDEFPVSTGGTAPTLPRVAAGGGGFAAVWIDQGVFFRRFNGQGQPLGAALRLDTTGQIGGCDVAVNAAGDALAVWEANGIVGQVFARRVSAGGTLGDIRGLTASGNGATGVRVAAAPDGGFLALWDATPPFPAPVLQAVRLDAAGNLGSLFQVNEGPTSDFFVVADVRPLFRADGGFSVLWRRAPRQIQLPIPFTVEARNFDAAGNAVTHEIAVDLPNPSFLDAARASNGKTLVFTATAASGARGRLFDATWNPLSATLLFQAPAGVTQAEPAVAVDGAGDFLALWTLGSENGTTSIVGRTLAATTCGPGSETLCLGENGRFQARVGWRNPFNGETGTGRTLPLTSGTGAFWFFGPDNLELMVKVLDGGAINGHFWIYSGALSNVEYTLTVTDSVTGGDRAYHNPPFEFSSFADVTGFPSATPAAPLSQIAQTALTAESSPSLLLASRFTVSVRFTDPRTGVSGQATAVPVTEGTGAFWFFGPENLELMVKVLDGRTVNGHFWVFYGATSDVAYTLTVTDTETGRQTIYNNPRGTLASLGDTEAF